MSGPDLDPARSPAAPLLAPLEARPVDGARMRWLALPGPAEPRLLLPRERRPAASLIRRIGNEAPGPLRPLRFLASLALRAGAASVVPARSGRWVTAEGADRLAIELRRILGADLTFAVRFGPARANRKPVLFVMDPDGRPLAFVKVGNNAVTRPLVRHEAEVLRSMGGQPVPGLRCPAFLDLFDLDGASVLVMDALPRRAPGAGGLPVTLTLQLARSRGITRNDLPSSPFGASIARWAAEPESEAFRPLVGEVLDRYRGVDLEWGVHHGDWTPWNVMRFRGKVYAWDWERFSDHSPIGYDVLHYLVAQYARQGTFDAALREAARASVDVLRAGSVVDEAVAAVNDIYLLDMLRRYVRDRRLLAHDRLDRLIAALVAVLQERLVSGPGRVV